MDYLSEEDETAQRTCEVNERPKDVVDVHVFRADFSNAEAAKEDMSALIITGTGNVYGTGHNTMVGWRGKSPLPMKENGQDVLEDYVKVEALSGLGIRKIVVGLGFGAALTYNNQMYMWGGGPKMLVEDDSVVMVQEYRPGSTCHCGTGEGGKLEKGGIAVSVCQHSGPILRVYTARTPPPVRIPVKILVKQGALPLKCLKCGKPCSPTANIKCCTSCDLYRVVGSDDALLPQHTQLPTKKDSDIIDINCGLTFLCTLSVESKLTFVGWKYGNKYETSIDPPENSKIQSFSCGKKHLAVLTITGDLYSYGDRDQEWLGWGPTAPEPWIPLRKVNTPGPCVKVCCGERSNVCLMADHTLWATCNGVVQTLSSKAPQDVISNFTDIAGVHFVDNFFFKASKSPFITTKTWLHDKNYLEFNVSNQDCILALMKSVNPLISDGVSDPHPCNAPIPPSQTHLYGKEFLSDLKIKLSDGEFPAHRTVLMSTSKYFEKAFASNDAPLTALDMTAYNPRAYRALLQHFYQVEPSDLNLDDLLDLCSLATSYEEPSIVANTVLKLRALITVDNVQQLLAKGKFSGNTYLISECEAFICSPIFRDRVIRSLLQDPTKLLQLAENKLPQLS